MEKKRMEKLRMKVVIMYGEIKRLERIDIYG